MTISKSQSASTRQPVATKPLRHFQDYTTANGQRALSVQMDIRDLGRFYAEAPLLAGGYSRNWHTAPGNQYMKAIYNAGDALDAMAAFEFPAGLRAEARRASRQLAALFAPLARLQVKRDRTAGRLDRRKFAAIARHTAAGTYDVDRVRPYRQTMPTPAELPTVAIVSSAANTDMWRDETYIPRVLGVTLGVQWACEAVGLPVTSALTAAHCRIAHSCRYGSALMGIMLAQPGKTISPRAYGVALHRDLWRFGKMTIQAADPASSQRLAAINPLISAPQPSDIGHLFPSKEGGPAVHWARQVLGADMVIAIGAVTDAADADAHIASTGSIAESVAAIREQLAGR